MGAAEAMGGTPSISSKQKTLTDHHRFPPLLIGERLCSLLEHTIDRSGTALLLAMFNGLVFACSGKGRKFDKIEAFIKFGKGAMSPTVSARRDVCTQSQISCCRQVHKRVKYFVCTEAAAQSQTQRVKLKHGLLLNPRRLTPVA